MRTPKSSGLRVTPFCAMKGLFRFIDAPLRRCALPLAAVMAVALSFASAPGLADAYTVYGYEDELGMLHLSKSKLGAKYKELYSHDKKKMSLGYKGIIPILRKKDAIAKAPVMSMEEIRKLVGTKGIFVMRAAEPFLGAPYRFGGDVPGGVDCSGFTRAVFKSLGSDLPRNSKAQAACGVEVARDSLLPGDLIFFSSNPLHGINHVGIFLGQGRIIHSSSRTGGVAVQALNEAPYSAWYVTARRVALPAGTGNAAAPGLSASGGDEGAGP